MIDHRQFWGQLVWASTKGAVATFLAFFIIGIAPIALLGPQIGVLLIVGALAVLHAVIAHGAGLVEFPLVAHLNGQVAPFDKAPTRARIIYVLITLPFLVGSIVTMLLSLERLIGIHAVLLGVSLGPLLMMMVLAITQAESRQGSGLKFAAQFAGLAGLLWLV